MQQNIYQYMPYAANGNAPRKKLADTRIWYSACVPLLAVFIEMYATNFALGVLVWCCCIVSWTAACLLDRKYLKQNGVDVSRLSPVMAVLPPLYIIKRAKLVGSQNTAAIVFLCFAVYAAAANGFTDAVTMNEDDMVSQIRDNLWSNISGISETVSAEKAVYINDTIDNAPSMLGAEGKARWRAERDGERIVVTVKRGELVLKFEEIFDGYAFTSLKAIYYSDGIHTAESDKKGGDKLLKSYISQLISSAEKNARSDKKDSSVSQSEDTSDGAEDTSDEAQAA